MLQIPLIAKILIPVMAIVFLYAGYQYITINNLRAENLTLSQQVDAANKKAEENQVKANAFDKRTKEKAQLDHQNEELIKVVRNDKTNGVLVDVLSNAIGGVQKRARN